MQFSRRAKIGGSVLAALLLANLITFWPSKKATATAASRPGGPADISRDGAPPPPNEEMRARFQASLQKLPAAERQQVEERMQADRAFFDSVRNLPEQERQAKIEEHMKENPPLQIPGLDFVGGPGGPPGSGFGGNGPGGPGKGHIPDPSVRRSMDQRIADSQKKSAQ